MSPVLLSSQGIPEGRAPFLGLFLSAGNRLQGPRDFRCPSPRGLWPGRGSLENSTY